MGFRTRKSIKLFPGVRINLSKSGISTSIGVKGATLNLKPGRKAKVTLGLPGTGISYSTQLGDAPGPAGQQAPAGAEPDSRARRYGQLLGAACFVIGAIAAAGNPSGLMGWLFLIGGGYLAYDLRPSK